MELEPRLIDVHVPGEPRGTVLVLHGGASRRSTMMVSPTQLSVLRMIPIARRIARAGRGELAVFRLLNSRRGWDAHHTPVQDARWGLDRIAERLGAAQPTCVVGHSLGGRAALLTADQPEVRGTVALNPWVYPSDAPPGRVRGEVIVIHGTADRIADPARAEAVAERMGAGYVSVVGGKHAMLRRHGAFSGLAAAFATAVLLGRGDDEVIGRVRAGERRVAV